MPDVSIASLPGDGPRRRRGAKGGAERRTGEHGATVGYEAQLWKMADALRRYFWRLEETGRVAVCRGIIIGEGKQSLGVVLDLDVKRLEREWKV